MVLHLQTITQTLCCCCVAPRLQQDRSLLDSFLLDDSHSNRTTNLCHTFKMANASPWTTLHSAVNHTRIDIVRSELENGSDVNAPNGILNGSPLTMAAIRVNKVDGSWQGMDVVKILVSYGAHLDHVGEFNLTAIDRLAFKGCLEGVQYLFEQGADVHSALHLASASGFQDIVEYFVSQDVNVNLTDKQGRTARDYANYNGHRNVAIILKEHEDKCNNW